MYRQYYTVNMFVFLHSSSQNRMHIASNYCLTSSWLDWVSMFSQVIVIVCRHWIRFSCTKVDVCPSARHLLILQWQTVQCSWNIQRTRMHKLFAHVFDHRRLSAHCQSIIYFNSSTSSTKIVMWKNFTRVTFNRPWIVRSFLLLLQSSSRNRHANMFCPLRRWVESFIYLSYKEIDQSGTMRMKRVSRFACMCWWHAHM